MKIENIIRKRIKTVAIVKGEYPKEIEITQEEYEQLGKVDKFEGVKLRIKTEIYTEENIYHCGIDGGTGEDYTVTRWYKNGCLIKEEIKPVKCIKERRIKNE